MLKVVRKAFGQNASYLFVMNLWMTIVTELDGRLKKLRGQMANSES